MRLFKWITLTLAICVLTSAIIPAISEEDIIGEAVDPEASAAASVGGDTGLSINYEAAPGAETGIGGEETESPADEALPKTYARVKSGKTPLMCDALTADVRAILGKGEVVLVVGACDGMTEVAVNIGGDVARGFIDPDAVEPMSADEIDAYQDAVAETHGVALYNGDIGTPLMDLGNSATKGTKIVANGNYVEYSNDTVFVLNGKEIYANMVPDTGSGNCWKWAQGIYRLAWGCSFSENFEGKAATGMNLLRNLNDDERLLTPEHLKTFAQYVRPGCTIRVGGCTSTCSHFQDDGLSCGHRGHSLIIAEVRADGIVTLDSHSNSQHTRFYSWQGFCNSWKSFPYVKYIKWPGATTLPATETVGGYEVRACSETYRVRSTAASGAKVYTAPENGEAVATLAYPATFAASKRAVNTYGGCAWVYGTTDANARGWLPVNDLVANVNETISVTGVTLDRSKLVLLVGGTATIAATVLPIDATNKNVAWKSGDTGIASVNNGVVTAVAEGTCTLTAVTADGSKKATCEVQVVKAEGTKSLSKVGGNGTVKLLIGQRMQLVADFATKNGWKLAGVKLSNPNCVTVDKTGMVTAKAAGKTVITVVTKNNKKATLNVEVYDPYKLKSVKLSKKGTVKMKAGGTMKLYYAMTPSTAVATMTWKSSKPSVASVDGEGVVTAVSKGTCYVGVVADNGVYAKVKVKVS